MLLSFKNLMRFSLPNYERFLWKHSCSGPKRRKRLRSDTGYSKYPNTINFPSTRLRPCTWAPELCQNSGVSTLVPSEKGKKGVITLVPSRRIHSYSGAQCEPSKHPLFFCCCCFRKISCQQSMTGKTSTWTFLLFVQESRICRPIHPRTCRWKILLSDLVWTKN